MYLSFLIEILRSLEVPKSQGANSKSDSTHSVYDEKMAVRKNKLLDILDVQGEQFSFFPRSFV